MNLRKPEKSKTAPKKKAIKDLNLAAVVAELAANPVFAARGVQGIHAEVMRRLASTGASTFVDFSDIREMLEEISQLKTSKTNQIT